MMFTPIVVTILLVSYPCWQRTNQDIVDALIKQLGSPRFAERELAGKRLRELWPDAIPALRKAVKSPHKERALRAAKILGEFELRSTHRLQRFVKEGKIDLAMELFSNWPEGKQEKSCWEAACNLTTKLTGAKTRFSQGHPMEQTIRSVTERAPIVVCSKKFVAKKDTKLRSTFLFIRAGEVVDSPFHKTSYRRRVIFSSETSHFHNILIDCAVFACGSIHLREVDRSIIVSDGDVTIDKLAGFCIIIARGKVCCGVDQVNCHIISGKTVKCKIPSGNTIEENCPTPLGFQFFDPTREGITVETADNSVRVTKLTEGKLFRKAGVRTGDRITTVNGKAVKTTEAFRKVLRKHFAWEEAMTFRVLRDGKSLEIAVPRSEWCERK